MDGVVDLVWRMSFFGHGVVDVWCGGCLCGLCLCRTIIMILITIVSIILISAMIIILIIIVIVNLIIVICRFKEHEVEQDEPVCEMVTERKCRDVQGELKLVYLYFYMDLYFCWNLYLC